MARPFADIDLNEFDYELPEERIALYPSWQRDGSRILIKKPDGSMAEGVFRDLAQHIPEDCIMVFNDSRVVPARLIFKKPTGSSVELLLLRPVMPAAYPSAMLARKECTWECMVGNKRRFKKGSLEMLLNAGNGNIILTAEIHGGSAVSDASLHIRFAWNDAGLSFQDVLSLAGRTPLPPYIKRPDDEADRERYQTVYSRYGGSVAAPTAGLHFTKSVLTSLVERGIAMHYVTLHVGAGTFLPVKSQQVSQHEMHAEYFRVTEDTLLALAGAKGQILAVGTTAARTLESLYWLGVKIAENEDIDDHVLFLDQWEPYGRKHLFTAAESFNCLLQWMDRNGRNDVTAFTRLMIIPGYRFRVTDVLLTNFHQPKSTLLLLLAAFAGNEWKDHYRYALDHDFRFLSYGDASLFFRNDRSQT